MTSNTAYQAINAPSTGEIFLVLLTLSHALLPSSLYFVNNYANVVSNGITYIAWPFDIPLPELGGDALPQLTLTIDNVDRSIADSIKAITTPIDVTLQWVLASSPNVIEGGPLYFRLRGVEIDMTTIQGTLMFEDLLNEPFPYETYVPATAPGLF